jgi:hypothetical protein
VSVPAGKHISDWVGDVIGGVFALAGDRGTRSRRQCEQQATSLQSAALITWWCSGVAQTSRT